MTREEFLAKLEQALAALPYAERRDALNYYEEYFDSAGPENETQTIADLGSPEEVARSILESNAEPAPKAKSAPSGITKKLQSWRMWLGAGIAVLVLGVFLIQQSSATPSKLETSVSGSSSSLSQPQTVVSASVSSAVSSTDESASTTTENCFTTASNEPSDLTITLPVSDLQDVLELELAYGNVQFKTAPADTETATFEFKDFLLEYLHQSSPAEHQTCFTYKFPDDFKVDHLPKPALTITLPENALQKLKGKLAMGDLSLGEIALADLNVNLAMGDLNAVSLTTSSARVNLAMGDLEIDTLDCKEPSVHLAMGDAEIGLLLHSENFTLENAMGDVKLTFAGAPSDYDFNVYSVGTLRVDGRSYKVRYNSNSDSDRHARITSAMGSVNLSFQNQT